MSDEPTLNIHRLYRVDAARREASGTFGSTQPRASEEPTLRLRLQPDVRRARREASGTFE